MVLAAIEYQDQGDGVSKDVNAVGPTSIFDRGKFVF